MLGMSRNSSGRITIPTTIEYAYWMATTMSANTSAFFHRARMACQAADNALPAVRSPMSP